LVLKNFRSNYEGETEAHLERVLGFQCSGQNAADAPLTADLADVASGRHIREPGIK
jgi:hypothetical protein